MQGLERDGRRLWNAEEDVVAGLGAELLGEGGGDEDLGRVHAIDLHSGFVPDNALQGDDWRGGLERRRQILTEKAGAGDDGIGVAEPLEDQVAQGGAHRFAD